MLVRLAIDFENPATKWWDGGGRDLWESLAEGFDTSTIVLEESLAHSWLEQARKIPGWDDGPEYAPFPVALRDVDPDEDV
jgi:hypothetical protein